jgi:hypothetical protein
MLSLPKHLADVSTITQRATEEGVAGSFRRPLLGVISNTRGDKTMNRQIQWGVVLLLLASVPALAAKPKTMSIQVREGQLRSSPSYLSRVVTTLAYTDRVVVLDKKGSWLRVQPESRSTEGWMHESTLTKKTLKLESGDRDATTAVSSEEQALAGKGFNSDVEAKFKERNGEIDFTWVDNMEAITIPAPALVEFLKAGNLTTEEGGAK